MRALTTTAAAATALFLGLSFRATSAFPPVGGGYLAPPPQLAWLEFFLGLRKIPSKPSPALPAPPPPPYSSTALVWPGGYSTALVPAELRCVIDVRYLLLAMATLILTITLSSRKASAAAAAADAPKTVPVTPPNGTVPIADPVTVEARRPPPPDAAESALRTELAQLRTELSTVRQELNSARQERLDLRLRNEEQAQHILQLQEQAPPTAPITALEALRSMTNEQFALFYLNSSTEAELTLLAQVGATRAAALVAARPFATPEQLATVSGFGGDGIRRQQLMTSLVQRKPMAVA